VDLFVSPSRYFADLMTRRLKIPSERMKVVLNGINLAGYEAPASSDGKAGPPVLGYFCANVQGKGVDHLVGHLSG